MGCVMKTIMAVLLMGLIAGPVLAQEHQVFFKVSRKATRSATKTNWQSCDGSYGKDVSKRLAIEIEMKNMLATDDAVTLEWYFVAKSLDTKKMWVFDYGSAPVDLKSMAGVKLTKESPEISANIQNSACSGYTRKEGDKIEGYIVRIIDGVKIISVAGSSKPLEEIGKSDAELKKLLDQAGSDRSRSDCH